MKLIADIKAGFDILGLLQKLVSGAPVEVKLSATIPTSITVGGEEVLSTTLRVNQPEEKQ